MELRDLEIFLTLAEELHFGRTAERLRLTQGRVSQAIKKQERLIGAELFERSSRKVTLTAIGRQLFEDLEPVRRGLHESMERAKLAARGKTDVMRVGMIGYNFQELRPYFDAFATRHPGCDVRHRHLDFGNPFGRLRTGEDDLAIVWLPVEERDLTVGPVVFTEPVVLAMSAAHPLAARESVSLEDLGDQTVMGGASPGYWREALVPTRTPGGRPIRVGPTATSWSEMLPILSSGEAVSPVHAHGTRYAARPDIAFVPIHDAAPARWALVWRSAAETGLIRDFAEIVHDLGPLAL
ncbi:LysR family transcriptional regulator [Nonomuraea recticatena]|uniref:LysR substrate-binding domain-containing protein n=1 Tax=Nonomuraea recticatena TaxID=46178 RepID=UPI0031F8F097